MSYAPTITEGHDYSVSILTPDGRLVSHGQRDQAPHMGTFEASIQHLVKEVTEFTPGDVFIYNDPYTGGTHQNDVKIIRPIFFGGEVFAFAIALCHWPDVGGPMHGTFNPHATECYAEGLRMPPLKLYENDEPVKPIWDLIDMNIRVPKERVAERFAQYQAGRLVERRLLGYIEKFGEQIRSATRSRTRWTTPSGCSATGCAGSPTARTSSPTTATATSAARTSRRSRSTAR